MFTPHSSEAECLIEIIGFILRQGTEINKDTVTDWKKVVALAKKHGVFQYVYRYMRQLSEESKPSVDLVSYMDKLNALELRTGILQEHNICKLQNRFEETGIDHMFIKGSVTKSRYPDKFLRSMGDVDLLYDPKQNSLLRSTMSNLGFMIQSVGRVHDLYIDSNNNVVEAHRQLVSSSSPYYWFCEGIWSRASKIEGFQHGYSMRIEDEFLFNFIHLASHFKKGGVGIRFIVDVWIYKHLEIDWQYVKNKLSALNLERFYDAIDLITEKWFGGVKTDDSLIDEIENYILSGGIFGNLEHQNSAAIRNGKIKYFFNICFPCYEEMKSMFPSLRSRLMLPVAWIRRIFESLAKRRRNVRLLLLPIESDCTDLAIEMKRFFIRCGLE